MERTNLLAVSWGCLPELVGISYDSIILWIGGFKTSAFPLTRGVGRGSKVLQAGFLCMEVELSYC